MNFEQHKRRESSTHFRRSVYYPLNARPVSLSLPRLHPSSINFCINCREFSRICPYTNILPSILFRSACTREILTGENQKSKSKIDPKPKTSLAITVIRYDFKLGKGAFVNS